MIQAEQVVSLLDVAVVYDALNAVGLGEVWERASKAEAEALSARTRRPMSLGAATQVKPPAPSIDVAQWLSNLRPDLLQHVTEAVVQGVEGEVPPETGRLVVLGVLAVVGEAWDEVEVEAAGYGWRRPPAGAAGNPFRQDWRSLALYLAEANVCPATEALSMDLRDVLSWAARITDRSLRAEEDD